MGQAPGATAIGLTAGERVAPERIHYDKRGGAKKEPAITAGSDCGANGRLQRAIAVALVRYSRATGVGRAKIVERRKLRATRAIMNRTTGEIQHPIRIEQFKPLARASAQLRGDTGRYTARADYRHWPGLQKIAGDNPTMRRS